METVLLHIFDFKKAFQDSAEGNIETCLFLPLRMHLKNSFFKRKSLHITFGKGGNISFLFLYLNILPLIYTAGENSILLLYIEKTFSFFF